VTLVPFLEVPHLGLLSLFQQAVHMLDVRPGRYIHSQQPSRSFFIGAAGLPKWLPVPLEDLRLEPFGLHDAIRGVPRSLLETEEQLPEIMAR
jgi:hypothetical protein